MKDKNSIEEKDLDKLLNGLFLEENFQKMNEGSVRFILEQEYDVKINAKKEKEFLKRLNGKPNGTGYWIYLIAILAVVTVFVGLLLYNKNNSSNVIALQSHSDKKVNILVTLEPIVLDSLNHSLVKPNDSSTLRLLPFVAPQESKNESFSEFSANHISDYHPFLNSYTSTTRLFKPSEEDFVMYSRVKTKMLEKLLNTDKGLYSSIEEGKIQYRDSAVVIDPFILRNQAITNLEYKVFLCDLIKKDKMDDFKKAAVKNEVWIHYTDSILANVYFFDNKYNDFPVVNVNAEGAMLFCNWLESEINLLLKQQKSKSSPIKIRLPFDSEWIFATRRGYAQIPDCSCYNTIYDFKEGIVDATYIKRIALIKERNKSKMTELDQLFSTNRYGMDENQMLQLFEKGSVQKSKLVSDSLYPNKMDVYSKVAHVSEIIGEHGNRSTKVVGSCWNNKEEYLKMLTEFKNNSASPFIGFRIVIINDNKASYKNPFW